MKDEKDIEIENLKREILYLKQELANIKRMLFGKKSERFVPDDSQLTFFDTPEEKEDEKKEISTPSKKKKTLDKNKAVRKPLDENLPRVEIIIEPIENVEGLDKIGEVISEILEYKPGVLYVKRFIRPKYAKPNEEGVIIGDMPSLPIPKGNAGASLLAHLMVSKYVDHLPFHRQKKQFKRLGVELAESTINDWFKKSCKLLQPLYDKLYNTVQTSEYIMADETPMPVQSSEKENSTHKGYQWVYLSPLNNLVCFDYQKTRSREGPQLFFKDFKGAIQSDGYAGYHYLDNKKDITLLTCMAHARRKFEQALDDAPEEARHVLTEIQKLYAIEREAKENDLSFDERKTLRLEKAKPILDALGIYLKSVQGKIYLPKSDMGKALNYTIKLWHRLIRYIEDGRYEIDNNPVERTIRPVALGRKNYLFAGSHTAAQYAAMAYSFFGSCKMNDVNPYTWLTDVLERISNFPANRLEELLPHNWNK